MPSFRVNPRQWTLKVGLASGAFVAVLLMTNCHVIAPRHGWSERWGPLVSHESFPGDCSLCHLPENWHDLRPDFSFDHEKETGTPLRAAHARAACLRCHNDRGPVQAYVSRGCGGCHIDTHQGTLGPTCTDCHNEQDWRPGGLVAEHAETRFPLAGPHAVAACESCHPRAPVGVFVGAPTRCEACHESEYAQTTSPNHAASGFPLDCAQCHSLPAWQPAKFNHAAFPLTGGHSGLDCTACHTPGTSPAATPSDCFACHQNDYQGAPNHVSLNFSRTCAQCHSTTAWRPAALDHSRFPLTGGHSGLDCTACHTPGSPPAAIPSDCASCHLTDYQQAPNHVALGFPQDCAQCHATLGWQSTTFSHRFPLTGPHSASCSVCHDAGNTQLFTCFNCHEHSQARMDDKHKERAGYTYTSQACVDCHPNGKH